MNKYITLLFLLINAIGYSQKEIAYYDDGTKKSLNRKKGNIFVGKQTYWYSNGKKQSVSKYNRKGVYIERWEWDESGTLTFHRNYKRYSQKNRSDLSNITWKKVGNIFISFVEVNSNDDRIPITGDVVKLHYIGYYNKGGHFDNSYERNQPFEFRLGQEIVIEGFEEGVKNLKEGQIAFIKIPPEFGYGNKPYGNIPPNSTIVYRIELLEIIN